MIKLCQQCNNKFDAERKSNRFCCPSCWYEFTSNFLRKDSIREKKCQLCEKKFFHRKNLSLKEFAKQMFCSNLCRNKWKKTDEYRQSISDITKKWYRENGFPEPLKTSRFNWEYKKWRDLVLERDNHICVWCGATKNLQVDHIEPYCISKNKESKISNGRTLCFDCHKLTDTYGRKSIIIRKNLTNKNERL